jgi:predicted nucleotidyltransferase
MNPIKLVILFGSRAVGKEIVHSDTDIAVLAERPLTMEEKSAISEEYAAQLGVPEDSIDLVDLWFAPPLLKHQISESGKLLFGDESQFIRFRVQAWKQYQNTARFRRARLKSLESSVNVEGSSSQED